MKAISVKQPWANLLAWGMKRYETRSQRFALAGAYVAVHASRTFGRAEREQCGRYPFDWALAYHGVSLNTATHVDIPRGVIVAVAYCRQVRPADAADVVDYLREHPKEQAFGDFTAGRWAYEFDPVWPVWDRYVFARGALGTWTLPDDVERKTLLALQVHNTLSEQLPDELTSAQLRQDAADAAEMLAEQRRQLGAIMAPTWPRCRTESGDGRSPIERMIDKAVKRG